MENNQINIIFRVIFWIIPLPIFFGVAYVVVELVTPDIHYIILMSLALIVVYNQMLYDWSKKISEKLCLSKYREYLVKTSTTWFVLCILGLFVYMQINARTFGNFDSFLSVLGGIVLIVVVFGLTLTMWSLVLGIYKPKNFDLKLYSHFYWNVIFLVVCFMFRYTLGNLTMFEYMFLYFNISIISVVYIATLLKEIKKIKISNDDQLFALLFIVGIFIMNMMVLNLMTYNNISEAFGFAELQVETEFTIIYYTIINITSVGFGDVYPVSEYAKISSAITSIYGYFLLFGLVTMILNFNAIDSSSKNSKSKKRK